MKTAQCYYQNDRSVAQAAEKLYIHKNTLQYKLNNIYTKSGFNPRNFEDAVLLYLAIRM